MQSIFLKLLPHIESVISSILLLMDPFIKECHINIITEEQEEFSMSIRDQLVSLLTSKSEIGSSPKGYMLESSI